HHACRAGRARVRPLAQERRGRTMSKTRFAAALAAGVLALAAAGCGGDDDGNGNGAATNGEDSLRVAILLPGAVSDQGYNADGQRAAQQMEEELGADVTLTEGVAVPNPTDVYRQ